MNRRWYSLRSLALLFIVCAIATQSSAARPASPPKKVQWQTDLDAAHKLSLKTGKPMLVIFTARWCRFCTKLKENTIEHPKMVDYVNSNFVPVMLNFDREKRVVKILEVQSIPCTVVLSPQADLLGKLVGYVPPSEMRKTLAKSRQLQDRIQQARQSKSGAKR